MNIDTMKSMAGVPVYPDIKEYANVLGDIRIWDGDGWKEESMSWKESCYLHSGLSALPETTFKGPDAQKFISSISINNCYKWPVASSKHLVMCDENGLVTNHCLTVRNSEDSFSTFACLPWADYQINKMNLDVQVSYTTVFILQVAGPTSLQVLEKVTGESIRDLKFLAVRPTNIPGINGAINISRLGMSGSLAYELRGPIELGPAVYDAVYHAGKPLGIKRLGWRTYCVNHTEGGFPQLNCTFTTACYADPDFMSQFGALVAAEMTGSVDPSDGRARFRTPVEVGWGWMAKFDHDFIGRKALEAEIEKPKRTIVTLRWNPEDVMDIYSSLLKPGEEYKELALPCGQTQPAGGHADYVLKDGKQIGYSSSTVYSYYYREVISHCAIDIDQAQIGNEVIVHWGDYGKRIKEVRATVERYPYLESTRNQDYNLDTVPSGVTER